ncbi:protein sprouty homolog 2 [Synchiropus picturatus]
MDSRSQNNRDGGGGRHGWSPSSTGTPHDEGRPQPQPSQTQDGVLDPRVPPLVLALDKIKLTGSTNEYSEGPTVAKRSPASLKSEGAREERANNLQNLHGNFLGLDQTSGVQRPFSVDDSHSSIRTSLGSASSAQRLLGSLASSEQIIRTQPKRIELNTEELKQLNDASRTFAAVPASGEQKAPDVHSKCEDCGQCRCLECRRPRPLPSCWMCGQRCMCSAQNVVEYGTCVCCVKGLFYHCSSDDEDTCADKPFSCTQAHCCVRWTTASLLAVLFPCLLCYLPATGLVSLCQRCYNQVSRPGCRCQSAAEVHREAEGKPT